MTWIQSGTAVAECPLPRIRTWHWVCPPDWHQPAEPGRLPLGDGLLERTVAGATPQGRWAAPHEVPRARSRPCATGKKRNTQRGQVTCSRPGGRTWQCLVPGAQIPASCLPLDSHQTVPGGLGPGHGGSKEDPGALSAVSSFSPTNTSLAVSPCSGLRHDGCGSHAGHKSVPSAQSWLGEGSEGTGPCPPAFSANQM